MAIAIALLLCSPVRTNAQQRIRVHFTEQTRDRAFTGRVYVFFSHGLGEPRQGPDWFRPAPILAVDVDGLLPGQPVELRVPSRHPRTPAEAKPAEATLVFPHELDSKTLVGMKVQAVIRFHPYEREVGTGPGNGFSSVATVPDESNDLEFVVDKIVPPTVINDTEWTKVLRVPSALLSRFHQRPTEIAAAVRLPPSYPTNPNRRYPVILEIPGFGGALKHGINNSPYPPATVEGVEFLHVYLDPNCPLGHHVFADSANNGPVGEAFIEEFIPTLDAKFRTTGSPQGRFLTGHSSGGWSSLWLQVIYPDHFNGTWSTAPDPVDFRDFQRINIYRAGENMYVDQVGQRRPLARLGGKPALWYDDFTRMEDVLGPGGQLHSFEAVFSGRGPDDTPKLLWNRESGAIDPTVADTWKRYDIRLLLEQNWATLGPKLGGKLHVFTGEADTFYLEGATKLLKESLHRLGSDAVVEIHPRADHATLMTKELKARIPREISERFIQTSEAR